MESEEAIELTKQAGLFVSGLSNLIAALLEPFGETSDDSDETDATKNDPETN